MLDDAGKPVPGFAREDYEPMRSDRTGHLVRWKGSSLESLRGKPIRLRFHIHNARLYSYRAG